MSLNLFNHFLSYSSQHPILDRHEQDQTSGRIFPRNRPRRDQRERRHRALRQRLRQRAALGLPRQRSKSSSRL